MTHFDSPLYRKCEDDACPVAYAYGEDPHYHYIGGPVTTTEPPTRPREDANLGLATTEDLMRELICRFKMTQYVSGGPSVSVHRAIDRALVLAEMLGNLDAPEREYRTVDGD